MENFHQKVDWRKEVKAVPLVPIDGQCVRGKSSRVQVRGHIARELVIGLCREEIDLEVGNLALNSEEGVEIK